MTTGSPGFASRAAVTTPWRSSTSRSKSVTRTRSPSERPCPTWSCPHTTAPSLAERRRDVLVAPDVLAVAVDEDDDPLRVVALPRADVQLAHQPSTISAAGRAVAASPATSSVVTIDSRHGSRSWRILSGGPDQREPLDQLLRDRRRRLVLLAVQVEVLDLVDHLLVAHADRRRWRGSCAPSPPCRRSTGRRTGAARRRPLDVVGDDERDGGARPRSPRRRAGRPAGRSPRPAPP